jgi:outer membrane protein
MRNRIRTQASMLGFLVWPVIAWAQASAPAPAAGKIALINIQGAILSTKEGQKAFGDLQKKYLPLQQDLQRQQQEIQALQDQLLKQATTLSEDEQLRLKRQLDDKQKIFTRASDDFNTNAQNDRQEVINRIGQKMLRVIEEYGQQNNVLMVVDYAQVQIFYYWDKGIDITDEIVKRFDTANPGDGAATPQAPPARSPSGAASSTPGAPRSGAAAAKPPVSKPAEKPKP